MLKQYKDTLYKIDKDGKCFSEISKKFLKPQMSLKYPMYTLQINGQSKKLFIHKMVAETFLQKPNIKEKLIVNHKDGNTKNYNVENLEWCTYSENSQHAVDTGLLTIKNKETIFLKPSDVKDWKECVENNNYLISNNGDIVNKKNYRLIKPCISNNGYYQVSLWKNNKGKTFNVHSLVYHAFKEEDTYGFVINHKDGNKLNNNINNSEKITYSENFLHACYEIKTNPRCRGIIQLDKKYNQLNDFPSIAIASKTLGICASNISRAATKGTTAGGYYWRYK